MVRILFNWGQLLYSLHTYVPGLAASTIVVDEPVDGGVDHKEEVALANVPMVQTYI